MLPFLNCNSHIAVADLLRIDKTVISRIELACISSLSFPNDLTTRIP